MSESRRKRPTHQRLDRLTLLHRIKTEALDAVVAVEDAVEKKPLLRQQTERDQYRGAVRALKLLATRERQTTSS